MNQNPLFDRLESRQLMAAVNAAIDFGQTYQTIDGMGASLVNWLSTDQLPELGQASFYDQLVNDLGASAIRGAIHPAFEQANDNNDPNVFDWTKFNTDALANALTFFKRMKERGVNTFLLSVWTPPYWQKTNLSNTAGGFLLPEMRAEFAEFVAGAVIVAKRDYGIDVSAVSVQNEQFFHEWYESSLMDNIMLRETVLAVQKKFAAEHLNTKVLSNEDLAFNGSHRWEWFNDPVLNDPQVDKSKLIIGSHYASQAFMPAQAAQLANTNVPLWYTEVSGKTASWPDGLATAFEVSDAITKANSSAYFYWQFDNRGSNAWDANSALLNDGLPTGKYYAVKHIYKYVRPGMKRVSATATDTGTAIGAYTDKTSGASTITLINNGNSANDYTLNMSNFPAGTVFRAWQSTETAKWVQLSDVTASGSALITLPAKSIVTLYSGADLPLKTGSGEFSQPGWGLIDPMQGSDLRYAARDGDLAGVQRALLTENVNAADPLTGWTALHAAMASPFYESFSIVEALLAAGANPNAVATNGFTPLHALAANGWPRWEPSVYPLLNRTNAKINAIIDAGAYVNSRDAAGRTPLHWAASMPVMYSEYEYYTNVGATLLSRGANLYLSDNAGKSVYDYATADFRDTYVNFFGDAADTVAPFARYAAYNADANAIDITTSENTTVSFAANDVAIINTDTNTAVTGWTFTDVFSNGITVGKVSFAARLPDGHYRMTIAAGAIYDQRHNASTQPIVVNFGVLRGDADGNGVVNFDDLLIVSQNYGQPNRRWSTGDFTGDGLVNFDDLLLISQKYGSALSVSTSAPSARLITTGKKTSESTRLAEQLV